MTLNKFIFSDESKYKITRHIVFWLAFTFHFVIQNLMIGGPGEGKTSRTFLQSFHHFLYFLPIYFLSTYFFILIVLPKFLYPRRWAAFILVFLLLFAVTSVFIYYAGVLYLHNDMNLAYGEITFKANKYHAIVDGMFVPFMLLGITAGIKFSKNWYLQQRENERLAKQKLLTELQLLKTSVHPRFLFHSLHTVEKHMDELSDQSPGLILQLSDLLSYILYESHEDWVSLEKELEILRYYITLEEKRFEDDGLFKIEFPVNTKDKFIIPLILMSIVEKSFEYFAETNQAKPTLGLSIRVTENVLHYRLIFSRHISLSDVFNLPDEKFLSVQKQLQNQYGQRYYFKVTSDHGNILAELKLPLYSSELINAKTNTLINEAPMAV